MKILHITDLHTGWKEEAEQGTWGRLYQVAEALKEREQLPDMAAVTGDLVQHGAREEFERTKRYLHGLRDILGLDRGRVFFCCGNHDADTFETGASFKEYEAFLERFYGGESLWQGAAVCSVNSCKRTSAAYYNNCWLDPEDTDRILSCGENRKKAIVLMHHQPEIFDDQSQIERLGGAVKLILGGHLHSSYARQYDWKGITVVNGVALMPHLDFIPQGFQIVDVAEEGEISTVMYVFKDGGGVWEERV